MAKAVKEPPPLRRFVVVLQLRKGSDAIPQRIAIHARYVGLGRSLELYFADSPIGRQDGYGGVQFDDCKAAFRPGQWLEFYELATGFEPADSNYPVTAKSTGSEVDNRDTTDFPTKPCRQCGKKDRPQFQGICNDDRCSHT